MFVVGAANKEFMFLIFESMFCLFCWSSSQYFFLQKLGVVNRLHNGLLLTLAAHLIILLVAPVVKHSLLASL